MLALNPAQSLLVVARVIAEHCADRSCACGLQEDEGLHHPGEVPRMQSRGGDVVMLSSTLAEEDEDLEPAAYSAYDSTGKEALQVRQHPVRTGECTRAAALLKWDGLEHNLRLAPLHASLQRVSVFCMPAETQPHEPGDACDPRLCVTLFGMPPKLAELHAMGHGR